MFLLKILTFYSILDIVLLSSKNFSAETTEIWGPGLTSDVIVLPARYFFIKLYNDSESNALPREKLSVVIDGLSEKKTPCRIWTTVLDRKDGTYIARYKLYESCINLKIAVTYKGIHIGKSPYIINNLVLVDNCNCPRQNIEELLNSWECGRPDPFLLGKLKIFGEIDWDKQRQYVITKFDQPHSVSLCHYVVKDNEIYKKCYGKYVGFNMFVDNILLSLTRKVKLPDIEFFANLGDWPLSTYNYKEKYPIISWCGSTDSYDIILPTYDITESTLENMGRVTLDMLSVQGNTEEVWENRLPKLFWRGRDSNKYRLELIKMAREHPDLFNASLTNFFFYRDEEALYGPKAEHVSFFKFFDYKYQLAIDGTVAPYRMPYLLVGGSLVFKPKSKYFEYFYHNLEPNVHYIPVETDLSDLIDKINWAKNNDEEAKEIAQNAQQFANDNLLPKDILCYHFHVFNEFSKIVKSKVKVLDGMEAVKQKPFKCQCKTGKDEL